ncbi:MAG: arylsulfatase [Roseibacillus sp.]|nr:arylsulfatase [Roseibacillus sp.]
MTRSLALFVLASCLPLFTTEAARPNILILYGDDLGFGDLGCYNKESKIPTPNLDQLAQEGLRFTDGHSSSGICTPSRYALLTGRHHWRRFHGIVGPMGGSVFAPDDLTLPEMLRGKGYTTAAIGKWHLGWDWNAIKKATAQPQGTGRRKILGPEAYDWSQTIPDGPLAHGFESYFGDTVINFPPYAWIENDRLPRAPDVMMDTSKWKKIKEGNWECRPGPMISDWDPYQNIPTTTKRATEFIKLQGIKKRGPESKPWFLYFAFPSPHAPIIPNDQFDGTSKAGPYGDFVHETDHACGRILEELKASGQAENTLVIFTADNGPEKYAYARDQRYDHWSAKPLRGLKRDIYEGGHHVPFIIRWPGKTRPGQVSKALMSQIDLFATIAEIVGSELPADAAEDSHNQLPVLMGEVPESPIRNTHIHNTKVGHYAIRNHDWLLIEAKTGYVSGRNAQWESKHGYQPDKETAQLFNLKDDLGQRHNLIAKHPEKATKLRTLLKMIRARGHSAPRLLE